METLYRDWAVDGCSPEQPPANMTAMVAVDGAYHPQVRSAPMNVRDAFYEVLRIHGIDTIFGNPGSNELRYFGTTQLTFATSSPYRRAQRSEWPTATHRQKVGPLS